jgi:hypothetical protein
MADSTAVRPSSRLRKLATQFADLCIVLILNRCLQWCASRSCRMGAVIPTHRAATVRLLPTLPNAGEPGNASTEPTGPFVGRASPNGLPGLPTGRDGTCGRLARVRPSCEKPRLRMPRCQNLLQVITSMVSPAIALVSVWSTGPPRSHQFDYKVELQGLLPADPLPKRRARAAQGSSHNPSGRPSRKALLDCRLNQA